MKKTILLLFLAALLSGGLFAAYQYYFAPSENFQSIYLVPKNAIYILETDEPIKNWQQISGSKIWKHLRTQPYFGELTASANSLDSLINDNARLFELFGSRHVLVSAHPYKRTSYDFLFVVDLEKAAKLKFLQDYLTNMGSSNFRITERKYNGQAITELYDKASRETLYIAFIENLLVCSYVNSLVEAAIDQKEEPVIGRDIRFVDVNKQVDEDGMFKVYMQYAFLDEYMRCYMAEENEYVNSLSKSLAYTGASVNLEDDKLLAMNGVTNINDSVSSYLKAMLQSGKGELTAQEVIPQRTAFYLSLSVADFGTFHGTFEQVMQTNPAEYTEYQRNVSKIEKFLKISMKENFIKWIGEEVAFVQTQPRGLGKNNEFAVVIKANDIKEAEKNLDFITKQIRRKTPVKFKEVGYKDYHINFMSVKGFFKPVFGKFFEKLDKPYFTIIDEYVVFSNHPQTLKGIIDDYDAEKTLAKSEAFTDFLGNFETASNVFVYIQTPVLHDNLKGFVSAETWADAVKNKEYIVCFPQLGFQLTENGELFNTRLLSTYQDPSEKPAEEMILANAASTRDSTQTDEEADEDIYLEDLNAEKFTETYENGALKLEVQMKDGFRNGVFKEYYPNGELKIKGRYRSDQKDGPWKYYDSTGRFVEKRKFDQGKEVSENE